MTKPGRHLKGPCSSAGLVIKAVKTPANYKVFELSQAAYFSIMFIDLMLTLSKMRNAFLMHTYFPITHAYVLGTRLGSS